MEITIKTKYEIGQRVYHILPDTEMGIITDISYKARDKIVWYLVCLGYDREFWARENEISLTKTF